MGKYCRISKVQLIIYNMLNMITAILWIGIAFIIQATINAVSEGRMNDFKKINIFSLFFIILYYLLNYTRNYYMQKISDDYVRNLRNVLFKKILGFSVKKFRETVLSDYLSILTNDIQTYHEGSVKSGLCIMQNMISAAIVILALFLTNKKIAMLVTLCTVIMCLIPCLFSGKIKTVQERVLRRFADIIENAENNLEGFYSISTYANQRKVWEGFKTVNHRYNIQKRLLDKITVGSEALSMTLSVGTELLILFVSAKYVFAERLNIGQMVAVMQLTGAFVQPLMSIMGNLPKISSGKGIERRFLAILHTESWDIEADTGETLMLPFHNIIELRKVGFSYANGRRILESIDLKIEKGKKYVFIGESGTGKTTLINIINGIYEQDSGEIRVDNHSVSEEEVRRYMGLFATVGQNAFLFNTNILDNITLMEEAEQNRLEYACRMSGVAEMLLNFQNGLDEKIQDNGSNLSGGQKQKIVLARAIYHNKPVLILDEGMSAIDKKSAYDIESRLMETENITLLAITHDITSPFLRKYDKIVFLGRGGIRAIGNYDELIENDKSFREFLNHR